MSIRMLGLNLLVLTCSLCLADPPKPSPAPSLGTETYTIHVSGTLTDVITALARITGCEITLDPAAPEVAAPPPSVAEAAVTLDFTKATLGDILASLCRQAGVTYEVKPFAYAPFGTPITIRPGNSSLDGRPTCVLDDYVLRVTSVLITQTRQADFRWGALAPGHPPTNNGLQLTVEVVPRSPDAGLCFAGVQYGFRAVPDAGRPLQPDTRQPDQKSFPPMFGGRGPDETRSVQLNLPLPDPAATKLTRLEGSLICFANVKVTEIHIPAGSQGKTLTHDDATVTVSTWRVKDDNLEVQLYAKCPPLVPQENRPWYLTDWQSAVLVGVDGRRAPSGSMHTGADGSMSAAYGFLLRFPGAIGPAPGAKAPAPLEPKEIILSFYRVSGEEKVVPFVIQNIPLP